MLFAVSMGSFQICAFRVCDHLEILDNTTCDSQTFLTFKRLLKMHLIHSAFSITIYGAPEIHPSFFDCFLHLLQSTVSSLFNLVPDSLCTTSGANTDIMDVKESCIIH